MNTQPNTQHRAPSDASLAAKLEAILKDYREGNGELSYNVLVKLIEDVPSSQGASANADVTK